MVAALVDVVSFHLTQVRWTINYMAGVKDGKCAYVNYLSNLLPVVRFPRFGRLHEVEQ